MDSILIKYNLPANQKPKWWVFQTIISISLLKYS